MRQQPDHDLGGATVLEGAAAPPRPRRRLPRILWLADRRGWAYDREGQCLARAFAGQFDVQIAYVQEAPDLLRAEFDLLVVAFWGETYHARFGIARERVVKQVASHRWQLEAQYGCLTPAAFAARHLADAGTVCAISQRLVDLLAPVCSVARVTQGVEVTRYARQAPRRGRLVFGWAGNAADACKGLHDVLALAAGAAFELRIADGSLDAAAMVEFYRGIDVLCIASTAEGEPLPLLEAMASGCFVLATDVGVVPELIRHEQNGRIVERTPAAFARAMQWCEAHAERVRAAGMTNIAQMQREGSDAAAAAGWRPLLLDALARLRSCAPAVARAPSPSPTESTLLPLGAVARAKASYADHYTQLNHGDLDGVYHAAAFYYGAELDALLPLPAARAQVRALDVGCGYGLLLRFLLARGVGAVDGIELDPRLHAIARNFAAGAGTVWCGDAMRTLPTLSARYDLVTAYDLIEHFDKDDALRFAAAVHGALAPGGRAVFRTPNMANVLGVYSRCMDLTHQVGFTEQSLTQLLHLAGFQRVELALPEFPPGHPLSEKIARSRAFHRELFELQDRAMPRCFDKNLVMVAHVA